LNPPTVPAPQTLSQAIKTVMSGLARDRLLLLLLAALPVLGVLAPVGIASYGALVDWATISALGGLLLLTKGLEASGVLGWLGNRLTRFMTTERGTALSLLLAAAVLSTLLTNDVALFVVVPLTLGICRITGLPATRLIIFEALAVNAGSALTPIGNPQNLFLWQLSGVSFGAFTLHMAPLVGLLMLLLLALAAWVFPARPVQARSDAPPIALNRRLMVIPLVLYLPFLVAADLHQAAWGFALVLLVFLLLARPVLAQVDWGLLLVFVLMFLDLRLLTSLGVVHGAMTRLGLSQPTHLYFTAIGASQVISNVPAAIALAQYSKNWQVLAYGVAAGGFGSMLGSLANLIALRMANDSRAWLRFHVYSVPFLLAASAAGYLVLFGSQPS
jgi:di/tricarboxylate transporter